MMKSLGEMARGNVKRKPRRRVFTGTVVHIKLHRKPEEIKAILARARLNATTPAPEDL